MTTVLPLCTTGNPAQPNTPSQSIPVLAVSPLPKKIQSHVDDLADMSIIPTSLDPNNLEIDWSKAAITPPPASKHGKI